MERAGWKISGAPDNPFERTRRRLTKRQKSDLRSPRLETRKLFGPGRQASCRPRPTTSNTRRHSRSTASRSILTSCVAIRRRIKRRPSERSFGGPLEPESAMVHHPIHRRLIAVPPSGSEAVPGAAWNCNSAHSRSTGLPGNCAGARRISTSRPRRSPCCSSSSNAGQTR